jgi:hypothetical protein
VISENDRQHQSGKREAAAPRYAFEQAVVRTFGLLGRGVRWGGGDDFLKQGDDVGNTEWFL